MTSRYETSPANLRALRDRLTQAAKREGVVFGAIAPHPLALPAQVKAPGVSPVF